MTCTCKQCDQISRLLGSLTLFSSIRKGERFSATERKLVRLARGTTCLRSVLDCIDLLDNRTAACRLRSVSLPGVHIVYARPIRTARHSKLAFSSSSSDLRYWSHISGAGIPNKVMPGVTCYTCRSTGITGRNTESLCLTTVLQFDDGRIVSLDDVRSGNTSILILQRRELHDSASLGERVIVCCRDSVTSVTSKVI